MHETAWFVRVPVEYHYNYRMCETVDFVNRTSGPCTRQQQADLGISISAEGINRSSAPTQVIRDFCERYLK